MDDMRDLYVVTMVSFDCPQEVPARARRMFRRALARLAVLVAWSEKVKCGSRVTPRILGWRLSGKG